MRTKKYFEYWNDLQRLPTRGNLPDGATYLRADKDEGYFVDEGEFEAWYGDGSNRLREWLENLLAFPAKLVWWKRPPRYLRNMYYSFANVSMELNRRYASQDGLRGVALTTKPNKIVAHSRGVWILGQALRMVHTGLPVDEVILYGIPHPGGRKFARELEALGVKITQFVVEGDWVTKRPAYGKTFATETRHIANEDNLRGIKNIHLSYGRYLKRLDI